MGINIIIIIMECIYEISCFFNRGVIIYVVRDLLFNKNTRLLSCRSIRHSRKTENGVIKRAPIRRVIILLFYRSRSFIFT